MSYEREFASKLNEGKGYDVPDNLVLWKYISFEKFINMINFNKLFLRRLDKFEDKFEGTVPSFALSYMKGEEKTIALAKKIYEARRKLRFVDCWTIFNGKESYAMWKVYSSPFGVALETSSKQLAGALPKDAYLIRIKYFDFKDENSATINSIPMLADPSLGEENIAIGRNFSAIKSLEYEYEKEVRVVFPYKSDLEVISFNIDMSKIINRIIISPYAPQWFEELITDLVTQKYCLKNVIVKKSDIQI